jgi:hypothetical protein
MGNDMKSAKDIFLVAIEKYSPVEWSAYLEGACNAGLRKPARPRSGERSYAEVLQVSKESGDLQNDAQLEVTADPRDPRYLPARGDIC